MGRPSKRLRSAVAAEAAEAVAAATAASVAAELPAAPSSNQQQQDEQQQDEDALPAEEEELDDIENSDSGSSSDGEGEGDSEAVDSDADTGDQGDRDNKADADEAGEAADDEGNESAEAESDEAADEDFSSEDEEADWEEGDADEQEGAAADQTDADAADNRQAGDGADQNVTAAVGDEQDEKGASKPKQKQQQSKQQLQPAIGTADKPANMPKGKAKAAAKSSCTVRLTLLPQPKRDYSNVLNLSRAEQQGILAKAEKVRRARAVARGAAAIEPRRNKCHWDHLLGEVEWMAKEFQRERAWKLKQAKRFVRAVKASKLDVESRALVRAQEELAAVRRQAGWIAKQVAGYWKKAERVVNYKVYVAIETRKRQELDKHLDMMLGQTERFSKMLAEKLHGSAQREQWKQQQLSSQQMPLALPALDPAANADNNAEQGAGSTSGSGRRLTRSKSLQGDTPVEGNQPQAQEGNQAAAPACNQQPQQFGSKQRQQQPDSKQQPEQLDSADADESMSDEETLAALAGDLLPDADHDEAQQQGEQAQASAEQPTATVAADGPIAGKRKRASNSTAAIVAPAEPAGGERQGSKRPRRCSNQQQQYQPTPKQKKAANSPTTKGSAAAAAKSEAAAGDADFQSSDEESSDDEATLEEEEQLAEADDNGGGDKELDALDEEANLPIEELLARYGFVVPDKDAEQQHHDSDDEGQRQEAEQDEMVEGDKAATDPEQQQEDAKPDTGQQQYQTAEQQPQGQPDNKDTSKQSKQCKRQRQQHHKSDDDSERHADGEDDQEAMVAASKDAASAQPTGYTLATTQVKTPIPFLLKHTLREYQHIGLDWLVSLYQKKLNGILADEMGLGKTIQTVALLAYLACEEGVWGPHLIVVPTSVMLNWEMEFKKWCPAFKLLTYYGSAKERKAKRQGWSKPHAFHVCITSYTLVLQDAKMFRRKKWRYLILDEAHMIKNWKSQRWQTLLRFNSKRRLLITGTPLQNDLMELWSLMHFLMPAVFSSHAQFKDWFSNPLSGAVETGQEVSGQLVERLHGVLRPFLLRRLKSEVEKQMPPKHEHVVTCRLSKRQRQLYDEYMERADTRAIMSGGNFMGVINVLMQLRKVCNHPDLFEGRAIVSAYDMPQLSVQLPSLVMGVIADAADTAQHLSSLGLLPGELIGDVAVWAAQDTANLSCWPSEFAAVAAEAEVDPAGYANDAGSLHRAGAAAAAEAGLVVPPEVTAAAGGQKRYSGYTNGMIAGSNSRTAAAAVAAAAQAADAVRQTHAQLVLSSGAALALSGVLAQQWQQHSKWRASRVAHAASVSLHRCGLDPNHLVYLKGRQQQQGNSIAVSGGWLPSDACGVPVGTSATGRFPDAAAFVLTAAVVPGPMPTAVCSSAVTAGQQQLASTGWSNRLPLCGWDLLRAVSGAAHPVAACLKRRDQVTGLMDLPSLVLEVSPSYEERAAASEGVLREFMFAIPRARTRPVDAWCSRPDGAAVTRAAAAAMLAQQEFFNRGGSLRTALVRRQLFFPDRRLLQYDCGKLVELDSLLRRLKAGGHRVLIFTQMAKMLDVLEAFLNLHGHTYMRLDGSTKPEQRQVMMQRFNSDIKYFVFILSTRSGGVGINLTGADTVVFYDSDWNPAMDQQAQDRCHRIGQTREVHIYRLISQNTIEENILRKSDQKRQLDWLAIQSGGFNTEMLAKLNLGGAGAAGALSADDLRAALRSAEDAEDAAAAAVAEKEVEAEMAEFTNEPPPEELKDEELDDGDEKTGLRAGTPASASTTPVPTNKGKHHQKKHAAAHKHKQQQTQRDADSGAASGAASGGADTDAAATGAETDKAGAIDGTRADTDAAEGGENGEGGDTEAEAHDLVMQDMATLQEGQSGHDLLTRLSASLTPIELFAVRFLESLRPVDVEAAAAAAVEDIKKEEWELDAIEKRKEQQEAEAEDSDEVVEGWDKAAADAAYQAYQEQIAQVLAAEAEQEAAAAAAAAAAAEEAEVAYTDADGHVYLGSHGGYTYSGRAAYEAAGDYSGSYAGADGAIAEGGEVSSPKYGGLRPRRGSGASIGLPQWGWEGGMPTGKYANLGSQLAAQQQLLKKQRMLAADLPGLAAATAGKGGRGRGRIAGRPPTGAVRGRGAGRGLHQQGPGALYASGSLKDEYVWFGDDENEDENGSASTAIQWQLLEEAGDISSQSWLQPAAAATAGDGDAALLPWEPQWDLPLVQLVVTAAAALPALNGWTNANGVMPDGSANTVSNSAAPGGVNVYSWSDTEWQQLSAELRGQLLPPVPRTALNNRVTAVSCRSRFLLLLQDFMAVQDSDRSATDGSATRPAGTAVIKTDPEQEEAPPQQQQQPDSEQAAQAANGANITGVSSSNSSSHAESGDRQWHSLPPALDAKMAQLVQTLQPAAQELLQSVISATAAASAAIIAATAAVQQDQVALRIEWQRCKALAAKGPAAKAPDVAKAGKEGDQGNCSNSSSKQQVALSELHQLAAAVSASARAAAASASAAAAAATASAGARTRRQSEGVKAAVGGPAAIVLAPTAAQMCSIMEESDADVLGAGSSVQWGAGHSFSSLLSPTGSLAHAAGGSGFHWKQASIGTPRSEAAAAAGAAAGWHHAVKSEPYGSSAWGLAQQSSIPGLQPAAKYQQQQQHVIKQQSAGYDHYNAAHSAEHAVMNGVGGSTHAQHSAAAAAGYGAANGDAYRSAMQHAGSNRGRGRAGTSSGRGRIAAAAAGRGQAFNAAAIHIDAHPYAAAAAAQQYQQFQQYQQHQQQPPHHYQEQQLQQQRSAVPNVAVAEAVRAAAANRPGSVGATAALQGGSSGGTGTGVSYQQQQQLQQQLQLQQLMLAGQYLQPGVHQVGNLHQVLLPQVSQAATAAGGGVLQPNTALAALALQHQQQQVLQQRQQQQPLASVAGGLTPQAMAILQYQIQQQQLLQLQQQGLLLQAGEAPNARTQQWVNTPAVGNTPQATMGSSANSLVLQQNPTGLGSINQALLQQLQAQQGQQHQQHMQPLLLQQQLQLVQLQQQQQLVAASAAAVHAGGTGGGTPRS